MNGIFVFLKKKRTVLFLAALSSAFFILASSYNFLLQKPALFGKQSQEFIKWSSPDETANYVIAKLYAQEGRLYFFEKYNLVAKDIIHPRSLRSDQGMIKPMSFIGMPLVYGTIARFAGYGIIPYLTPLLAAIGIIYYFQLIKRIFGHKNALVSSLLLFSFPVYLYFSARSMFHNIPFTVFVVIGLYYGAKMAQKVQTADGIEVKIWDRKELKKYLWAILAGSFFGLAIITRTSELLWLGPLLLFLLIANIKKISVLKAAVLVFGLVLSMLPAFYWNQTLYGSSFYGGYPDMNSSINELSAAGSGLFLSTASLNIGNVRQMVDKIEDNIFHFGFNPRQSYKMFNAYFVKMFPWLCWMSLFGIFWLALEYREIKKKHIIYICSFAAISLILVIYYGSWEFYDNPDKAQQTIGNSYTRYWLPVYLGAIPFASYFLLRFARMFGKSRLIKSFVIYGTIAAIFIVSSVFLLLGSDEGLIQAARKYYPARSEYDWVMANTENNAVIITRYHDKIFFPERKVIVGEFDDENMNAIYGQLAGVMPVYYYNFNLPPESVAYLNERRFSRIGLRIEKRMSVNESFSLYKLTSVREERP